MSLYLLMKFNFLTKILLERMLWTHTYFFNVILESELRVSYLLASTLLPLCSGYLGDWVSLYAQPALTVIILFYASLHCWDDRHKNMPSFFCWGRHTFLLVWSSTAILLISASQISRIAVMNHGCLAQLIQCYWWTVNTFKSLFQQIGGKQELS
jgi:hypothetical protein